jgi:hypothetical protein
MNSFLDSMNKTGWWPCGNEKCTDELVQSTLPQPKHILGEDAPKAAAALSAVFVDNSTSDVAQGRLEAWQQFVAKGKYSWFGHYDGDFYLEDGSMACPSADYLRDEGSQELREQYLENGCIGKIERDLQKECTRECRLNYQGLRHMWQGAHSGEKKHNLRTMDSLPAPMGYYELVAEQEKHANEFRRGRVHFTSNGWAKMAVANAILQSLKENNTGEEWILVTDGKSDQVPAEGSALQDMLKDIQNPDSSTGKLHLGLYGDCKGAWLLRSSEWSRLFVKRVQYGLLMYDDRVHGANSVNNRDWFQDDYAHPERGLAERAVAAGAAEAMCILLKRDSSTDGAVKWLTPRDTSPQKERYFDVSDPEENERLHRHAFGFSINELTKDEDGAYVHMTANQSRGRVPD